MDKRLKFAIFLIFGLILLGIGLYIFLGPILEQRQAAQPPSLPGQVQPTSPTAPAKTVLNVVEPTSTQPEMQNARILENRGRTVVERVGNGSSADGFLGYMDALVYMTEAGKTRLLEQQKSLQTQYPARGTTVGLSTRAIAARLGENQVFGAPTVGVQVEAIQRLDSGDPRAPSKTTNKVVTVTFVKQADGTYLVDQLEWQDLGL